MRPTLPLMSLLLFAGTAWSQVSVPFQCAVTSLPAATRIEGVTERPGDVLLTCTGGTPTPAGSPVPQVNFQLFYNADVTSRLLATGFSEALLLVDEPGLPANPVRSVCATPSTGICATTGTGTGAGVYDGSPGRPNIFQARQTGLNAIAFVGVPVDPPGVGKYRTFRVADVRLNASGLGPLMVPPTPLYAFVAMNGSVAVMVNNPQPLVGVINNGLTFSAGTPPAFKQCTAENAALAKNASANGTPQFSVTFTEGYAASFKRRTIAPYGNPNTSPAPVAQNQPDVSWETETGFFDPAFPAIANRGNLGVAGLADHGTRLRARFTGVPAGVKLYARAVITSGQMVARMVTTNGAGEGPFSPVAANSFGIAPVPVNGSGVATLVYEVLRADPLVTEAVTAPIYVAYATPPATAGAVAVSGALGPLASVLQADSTAPIPRFVEETVLPAFSIASCGCKSGGDDEDEDDDDHRKGARKSSSSSGGGKDCKKDDE